MIVIISSILMLMAMMSKLCLAEVQQKKKKKHQLTHKSSLSPSICLYDLELINCPDSLFNSFDLF